MGRRRKTKALTVLMNGENVGTWRIGPQGRHEFRYDQSWIENQAARPLSLSLSPLLPDVTYPGDAVEAYFDNLLPDSTEIRQRIRQQFGADSLSAFDLLHEIGRDCVGAVQLIPEGDEPGNVRCIESSPLTEAEVESVLRGVTTLRPGRPSEDSFRISLAGAQEKTALLWHNHQWHEPHGATPTTHILKLPLGRIGGMGIDLGLSIENEWLCARLATALGLAVARCEIVTFGEVKALAVERFDRRLSTDGAWIVRLPQEDFCQATGTPSLQKYEADGGPGILTIMPMLLGASDPFHDRRTFMKAQLLFWLLAAPDGHAKNFSLFLEQGGRYRLTPMYDIISAYPLLGRGPDRIAPERPRLAMAVHGRNRHYEWSGIRRRHWRETAARCKFQQEMEALVPAVLQGVPQAITRVAADLPPNFPDSVATSILEGLQAAADRLEREP